MSIDVSKVLEDAKKIIYDIAVKLDVEKNDLNGEKRKKYLDYLIEASKVIYEKTSNSKEKENYANHILLINELSQNWNEILLNNYLRLILDKQSEVIKTFKMKK